VLEKAKNRPPNRPHASAVAMRNRGSKASIGALRGSTARRSEP